MDSKTLNYILGLLLILSMGLNIYLGISAKNSEVDIEPKIITITDTIVRDSIQIREKTRTLYTTKFDTITVKETITKNDTIKDTVVIELPIEHKQYKETIKKDSISYDVQIDYSGFHPSLDRVEIGSNFIRQEVKVANDKPWRFGVMIGPYIGYGGQVNPTTRVVTVGPEVGIGIQIGWGYTFKTK